MKCPICGIGNLVRATRDLPYTYKGRTIVIRGVKGRHCANPNCREVIMEPGESARTSREMLSFNKEINGQLAPIDLLANVRRKLNLTQKQAAKVFGGGANAFSRYESGKTKPPLALIKLFGILDKYPGLLEEVASMKVATRNTGRSGPGRMKLKARVATPKRKPRIGTRTVYA